MSAWIILLILFCCNSRCGCDSVFDRDRDGDCGCDNNRRRGGERDCDNDRGRDRDRDRDSDRGRDRRDSDRDCDCDDSRFEPRFDARPFSNRDRDTCGCEEKND